MYSLALELLQNGAAFTDTPYGHNRFRGAHDSLETDNLILLDELQSDGDVIHQRL